MPPTVSLVIPVLSDADAASALLHRLAASSDVQIIIVDGGHDGRLEAIVRAHGRATLLRSPTGRARQMNAGAAAATGEWVLFLHADSTLPDGWLAAITAIEDEEVIGGWFRFALDDSAWQARVIERLTAWRVAHLRLPYGDQGFVVRRRIFHALGGFRDMPLMEDVDFIRRLVRAGHVEELPLALVTSARRWRHDGWFRRSTRNLLLLCLYLVGVKAERLARWYTRRA